MVDLEGVRRRSAPQPTRGTVVVAEVPPSCTPARQPLHGAFNTASPAPSVYQPSLETGGGPTYGHRPVALQSSPQRNGGQSLGRVLKYWGWQVLAGVPRGYSGSWGPAPEGFVSLSTNHAADQSRLHLALLRPPWLRVVRSPPFPDSPSLPNASGSATHTPSRSGPTHQHSFTPTNVPHYSRTSYFVLLCCLLYLDWHAPQSCGSLTSSSPFFPFSPSASPDP